MKGESAAMHFDDLEVPDESSAAISAGAPRFGGQSECPRLG